MGLLVLMTGVWSVQAQNPDGIPEVIVTVADDGISFTPSEISAGITTLTFENVREGAPFEGLVARLKEGVTPEDLMAAIGQGDPIGAFQLAHLYGGAFVPAETSWSITLDLKPGMHILADRNTPPAFFNIVASDGEGAEMPEADVTLAFVDFAFGIRSTINAGEQVWHIQNVGQQFHEAAIIRIDEDTSLEEATALLQRFMGPTVALMKTRLQTWFFSGRRWIPGRTPG
jgi:hypothetical protein